MPTPVCCSIGNPRHWMMHFAARSPAGPQEATGDTAIVVPARQACRARVTAALTPIAGAEPIAPPQKPRAQLQHGGSCRPQWALK